MAPRLLRIEWEIQIFSPSFSKIFAIVIYHIYDNIYILKIFAIVIYNIFWIFWKTQRKKIWISHSMHKSLGGINFLDFLQSEQNSLD